MGRQMTRALMLLALLAIAGCASPPTGADYCSALGCYPSTDRWVPTFDSQGKADGWKVVHSNGSP